MQNNLINLKEKSSHNYNIIIVIIIIIVIAIINASLCCNGLKKQIDAN